MKRMCENPSRYGLQISFGFIAGLIMVLSLAGCYKRSGEAMVFGKEHIAAMEISEKSKEAQAATPTEQATAPEPVANPNESAVQKDKKATSQGEEEITVDQYVMSPNVRGTSRDPRATSHEQWIVTVQMIEGGRQFNVQADQPQWEKVKIGDRIKVTYREGKYTGTVWDAEIQ